MAGSPSIEIHSNVARPSGLFMLQLNSQTPGAFVTPFTLRPAGHSDPRFAAKRSAAGMNFSLMTRENSGA